MKIVNSIMPMSDIEALAANGQKLRVAVTKTSAQGKSAQSATPNLMSFSTDENSIWFNGKMYGVHKFNNVSSLNTNSTAEQVLSALNVSKSSELHDLAHKGVLFIDTISGNMIVKYEDGGDTFQLYVPSSDSRSIKRLTITVSSNKVTGLTTISHLIVDDIRNTLTSTETNKALSAAMGKALNDRISGLGNVYRVKGTKTNLSDVLALTNAEVGDVWNVTNAFTLGGKPYPANTNVVCITATSSSDHDEGNWDPLGGTVNLSTYVLKSDVVDNTASSDTNKPLSANQGRLLGARLDKLEVKVGLYKLLKPFTSGSLGSKAEVDSLLGAYSTFSSAVTTGKLIYGIYNDSNSLTHTVTFTAYNSTGKKQIIMYAVINPTTMVRISADYEGTNWVTATIDQGAIGEGTIIE